MVRFTTPEVPENEEGWGPTTVPEHLKDVPYAPFGKGDKLGKASDWVSQGYSKYSGGRFGGGQGGNVNTVFNFFHNEEEDSFHLVDNRPVQRPRYGGRRFQQQRFPRRDRDSGRESGSGADRERQRRERQQQAKRGNWNNFWNNRDQQRVTYQSSVDIRPEWQVLEQIQLSTLTKLSAKVDQPSDMVTCGSLKTFDRAFDIVTPKTEKPLKKYNSTQFYNVTTSDDPVIRKLASEEKGNVFATDAILSTLMCAPRSVYSWDVVVTRVGNKIFLDKRDQGQFDLLTVNETSQDPIPDEKENINGVSQLSQEATMINQNFSQQVLSQGGKGMSFDSPNPFADESGGPVASVAYRYRQWKVADDITLVARTELDGVTQQKGQDVFMRVKALNEFDSKVTGVDWRQKIENQRGAVLATELKNNSNKLAKWTAQALLSGADLMKIGYVSRSHTRDNNNHAILGTQTTKPRDFATQMNLSSENMWGILKMVVDMCMKLDEGKYLLVKDPNKPIMRLYEVPQDAFDNDYSEEPLGDELQTTLTGGSRSKKSKDDEDDV